MHPQLSFVTCKFAPQKAINMSGIAIQNLSTEWYLFQLTKNWLATAKAELHEEVWQSSSGFLAAI